MMFIYPCEGRLTSGFRVPQRPDHHGIDLAKAGLVNIVSIADGVVSRSYTSTSYGEVIFVVHKIEGQEWESVYAHLRKKSRKVNVGDKVKQGQLLGYMGNTGRSFGQHLHFELHQGRWNINKDQAVDPLKHLGKEEENRVLKLSDKEFKMLADVYKRAFDNKLLSDESWYQKAAEKKLTVDEAIFVNTILVSRMK